MIHICTALSLGIYIGTLFYGCNFYADDIALLSCSCYGLQKLLDICSQYGFQWDIKFNPDKSYAGTLGGDHPTSVNVELSNKPLQWAVQLKYLGCVFRCRSCDIKLDNFVGKFYIVTIHTAGRMYRQTGMVHGRCCSGRPTAVGRRLRQL